MSAKAIVGTILALPLTKRFVYPILNPMRFLHYWSNSLPDNVEWSTCKYSPHMLFGLSSLMLYSSLPLFHHHRCRVLVDRNHVSTVVSSYCSFVVNYLGNVVGKGLWTEASFKEIGHIFHNEYIFNNNKHFPRWNPVWMTRKPWKEDFKG